MKYISVLNEFGMAGEWAISVVVSITMGTGDNRNCSCRDTDILNGDALLCFVVFLLIVITVNGASL